LYAPIHLNDFDFADVLVKSHLPAIVEFWSPGCGPCQMVVSVLEELAARFKVRLLIVKINVDENLKVAGQYGILGAPTILFMKRGVVTKRINGYLSIDLLKKQVEKFAGDRLPKKLTIKKR
jgi:thioredoxin 1